MILHHVAQSSGVVVITAAMFDAHRFGDGDGDIVNVAAVPERLEQRIGKTKGQNVLHRFLAEIVINPKDLRFVKAGGENGVQGAGRFQVVADRLLDHDPRPFAIARQSGLAEIFWNFAEHARRCGHVENAAGFRPPLFFQLRALFAEGSISLEPREITLLVLDVLSKLIPRSGLGFAETGELIDPSCNRRRSASSPSLMRSTAMIANCAGWLRSCERSNRAGISLRQARSPAPPKMTNRIGSSPSVVFIGFMTAPNWCERCPEHRFVHKCARQNSRAEPE